MSAILTDENGQPLGKLAPAPAPGIAGAPTQPIFWYSPISMATPSFLQDTRNLLKDIGFVLNPIRELNKAKQDILEPLIKAIDERVDIISSLLQETQKVASDLVGFLSDFSKKAGVYVLITLPDIIVRKYVWVPSVFITTPDGQVLVDRNGGFFAITDQQYAAYGEAKSAASNLPYLGQPFQSDGLNKFKADQDKLITIKDSTGREVKIDAKVSEMFASVGSNGIAGFVDKFNKSFIPLGTEGNTLTGQRSDLEIPTFTQGDIVAGLSFLISVPGFNNFLDAFFGFVNLFLPGNAFKKLFKKATSVLSAVDGSDQIIKPVRIRPKISQPQYSFVSGATIKADSDRSARIEAIDISKHPAFDIQIDTTPFKGIKYYKIDMHLKVDVNKKNTDKTAYHFFGAEKSSIKEAAGFNKILSIFSPGLEGRIVPTHNGQVICLTKTTEEEQPGVLSGTPRVTVKFGNSISINYPVDVAFFDSAYTFKFIFYSYYNRKITPEYFIDDLASDFSKAYFPIYNAIVVGKIYDKASVVDTVTGLDIRTFQQLVNAQIVDTVGNTIAFINNTFSLPTQEITPGVFTISNAFMSYIKTNAFNKFKDLFFVDQTPEQANGSERLEDLINEVYLRIKYGGNPRGNFWVDEIFGKSLRSDLDSKLKKFADDASNFKIDESDFEHLDEIDIPITPNLMVTSTEHAPLFSTTNSPYAKLGFGLPEFRFDRWFAINANTFWPALGDFLDRLKITLDSFRTVFPPLQSPYLLFVNSLLNELNKFIAKIDAVIIGIDNILNGFSILSTDLFHVIRLEDELGKGYTTGGMSKIREMILNSPGLPPFLRETFVTVKQNTSLTAEAETEKYIQTRKDQREQNINDSRERIGSKLNLNDLPSAQNIKQQSTSDAFVATVTFLAGAPKIPIDEARAAIDTFSKLKDLPDLQAQQLSFEKDIALVVADLSGLEGRKFVIAGQIEATPLPDRPPLEKQLDDIEKQRQGLNDRKTALEAEASKVQDKIKGLVSFVPPSNDPAVESIQSAIVKFPFDLIEQYVLGVTLEEKKRQVTEFNKTFTPVYGVFPENETTPLKSK